MPREYEKCRSERARRFEARVRLRRPLLKGSRRMNRRIARTAQVGAIVLALVLVPAALAAKGHGGGGTSGGTGTGGGTIGLVLLNSTDGLPHVGQQVTFNVSTTATSYPWV